MIFSSNRRMGTSLMSGTSDSSYSVFNLLSDGIWEIAADGKTLFGNKWICEYLGYDWSDFLTLNFLDEINKANPQEQDSGDHLSSILDLDKTKKHRFLTKSQRLKLLTLVPGQRKNEQGLETYLIVCSASFLQQELQDHFENLQELGNIGIWELDPQTGQTFWSNQVYHIHGVEVGTPTDKVGGINFYAPEERPRIQGAVEGALAGKPFREIFRFFDVQAKEKWIEVTGEPVFSDQGKVILIKGTFHDVSININREKKLRLVLNNVSEGYWDWNIADDYEFMSDRFWEILGYDPRTKKSHPSEWQKLIHPADSSRVQAAFENHLKDSKSSGFTADVRYKHGNGNWIWIRCSGKVVEWDSQGKPIRLVGTHQNITDEVILVRENKSFIDALSLTMLVSKTDPQGNITFVNDLFCTVSKFKTEELIGKNHRLISSGTQGPDFYKNLWQTITTKERFRGEVCNKTKDGDLYWLDLTISPFLGPDGEIVEFVSFGHLITERKEVERKLNNSYTEIRQAKQRLDLAVEGANLGTWSWDLTNNQVIFDERWAGLRGLDHKKLKQNLDDWSTLVHPEDLKKTMSDIQDYLEGRKPLFSNVHRVKHQDGSWKYILGRGRFAEWDNDGKPTRFVGTDMDVTESVIDEQVSKVISDLRLQYINFLGNQKEFFNSVLHILINIFESEYGFIGEIRHDAYKKPFLKTFALTDISWDVESKKFFDTYAPQGMEFRNLDTLFGEVIRTGQMLVSNSPSEHAKSGGLPKGHPPLNSFLGVPIYYNNQFIAMIGLANKKEGFDEQSIKNYQPILEALGEMVNSVKLNTEVEAQKQFANHKSRLASIGEMASGVGHEINNPLAIISGQMSLLKTQLSQKIQDPSLIARIDKSQKAVDRIANIVRGLRAFSRSDQESREVFNFSELSKETAEMLLDVFNSDGVEVDIHIDSDYWTNGNRGRWQQVLVNLLNNARDAVLGKDGARVILNVSGLENNIQVTVQDNGVGIPDHLREKIFDPFFTTKEVNDGTGIGLALTSTIIQEHGAKISLASKINEGTTFTIELSKEASPAGGKVGEVIELKNESPQSAAQSLSVLIVDDEEDIREALQDILVGFGFKVTLAPNGEEAFHLLKEGRVSIDVILSDMKMPKIDGPRFLKKVKEELKYQGLFFFITGGVNIDPDDFAQLVDGFLEKPFREEHILKLIREKWALKAG